MDILPLCLALCQNAFRADTPKKIAPVQRQFSGKNQVLREETVYVRALILCRATFDLRG
jgi:hypothetical protein